MVSLAKQASFFWILGYSHAAEHRTQRRSHGKGESIIHIITLLLMCILQHSYFHMIKSLRRLCHGVSGRVIS